MSGALVGAIIGLLIGVGLSIYVARLDYQKRVAGVRTRAQYRLSLFGVPVILAVIGALIGGLIA
jgi:ABC-type antimicrobial peptide transport system permease subunit